MNREQIDQICDFIRRSLENTTESMKPPKAVNDHFTNARLEFLKGIRAAVDHRIERLQRNQHASGASVPVD